MQTEPAESLCHAHTEVGGPIQGSDQGLDHEAYTSASGRIDRDDQPDHPRMGSRISRSRFVCTNYGSFFDTDIDAAKNIVAIGISPTGGLPEMACESSWIGCPEAGREARYSEISTLQGRE